MGGIEMVNRVNGADWIKPDDAVAAKAAARATCLKLGLPRLVQMMNGVMGHLESLMDAEDRLLAVSATMTQAEKLEVHRKFSDELVPVTAHEMTFIYEAAVYGLMTMRDEERGSDG
jgi:hypothetical protein